MSGATPRAYAATACFIIGARRAMLGHQTGVTGVCMCRRNWLGAGAGRGGRGRAEGERGLAKPAAFPLVSYGNTHGRHRGHKVEGVEYRRAGVDAELPLKLTHQSHHRAYPERSRKRTVLVVVEEDQHRKKYEPGDNRNAYYA